MLVKHFGITLFIFSRDPLSVMQAINGLIAVQNDSGLLIALVILNDSASMAE